MTRRAPHEGSIYQRKDGRWEAVMHLGYAGGKRRKKSFYGRTQQEVRRKLVIAQRNFQQGIAPPGETQTVAKFLDGWLESVARPTLRPSTFQSYAGIVRLHLNPGLGRIRLSALTPQHIQAFVSERSQQAISARRVQYIHAVLRRAMADAERWQLVPRNPASLVRPPRVVKHEVQPMTVAEARRLLSAASGNRFEALYALVLAVGLRQGEALGLRWADLELENGTLRVRHSLQRIDGRLCLVEPKTAQSRRSIAVPASVTLALRAHRTRQLSERLLAGASWVEGDFVFATRLGTPVDAATVTRSFHRLLAAAGLPRRTFHSLRHTCGSLMVAARVHPRVMMEILGHSQIAVTMNTYGHVYPEAQAEAANQVDGLIHPQHEGVQATP